jgi:hypothetical protein
MSEFIKLSPSISFVMTLVPACRDPGKIGNFSRGKGKGGFTLILNPAPCHKYLQRKWGILTPWSRVLLDKLTGCQLVKKFPTFYGTRRFITAFTSARHLSLFWAISIQSMHQHLNSRRSILILSSHLRIGLPSGPVPILSQLDPVHTTPPTSWRFILRKESIAPLDIHVRPAPRSRCFIPGPL